MRPIDYFDTAVDSYGERPALVDGSVSLSYRQVQQATRPLAAAIRAVLGGHAAAPIAILSPNDYRVVLGTLAAMRAGAVVAPLHIRNAPSKNLGYLDAIRPAVLFYHSQVARDVELIRRQTTAIGRYVCLDRFTTMDESLEEFAATGSEEPEDWGDVSGNYEHPVYLRQTSGTTGSPKMIIGDVGSFVATHLIVRERLRHIECDPVCLVAAPLSHAAGVHAFCMLTLGARLVLMPEFNALETLQSIERNRVTHLWLPASGLYLLMKALDAVDVDLSSLRSVVLGASGVAADKLRDAVRRLGPCISINYSQIESGFLTWLDERTIAKAVAGEHPERLASSGTSLYVSRIGIMNEQGALLGAGHTGEIVVRGRSVKPYVRRPFEYDQAEIEQSRQYGWHHTGDMGYFDEHGYLYVVGRKKDVINVGGFKVSADEVEHVILEIPDVVECAVVAVRDPVRGEAVKAVITVRPGRSVANSAIISHCRAKLGNSHCPSSIEQWTELPRTGVGKIDKLRIRELAQATP
ncbi:MAG TPA: class I adenylate-forming enzyme family protein [Vicinamibacterales bacterium]|nr:class I adenylate-forming enzyme family protein [Vicinamibacterales bacterium]